MPVLDALPTSTPVGLSGHSSDFHPTLHQIANTVIAAKSTPGAVAFSTTDGDFGFDGSNFVFDNTTNTLTVANLTVANLTVSGTLTGGGVSGLTPGAVTFGAADGSLTTDSTGIFYSAANDSLRMGNGTAAAPSYSWINSTGTGLFRAGADIVGVATAGVQRMQVDATGAVQIGATSANSRWLKLGGAASHPDTSGTTIYGFDIDYTGRSTATSVQYGMAIKLRTQAAAYTLGQGVALYVNSPTIGAASAVTLSRGIGIGNQGASGVTNAYGLDVEAQSGAATLNIGVAIRASTTATLWVGSTGDDTTASAGIMFGLSRDTNLYRAAANVLVTDDTFRAAAGNAGAPGLSFTTDTNNGMFLATTDAVGFSTNSTERARFTAEGALLLGVQTNAAMWFRIGGGATHPDTTSATTVYGIDVDYTSAATATSAQHGIRSRMRTTASAYTVADLRSFTAAAPSYGASSAVTIASGVYIENHGTAAVTTAYGLRVDAQTNATSNVTARFDASALTTVWVSANADNTTAAAGIAFGSSRDTNLYRAAAGSLRTDGNFGVGGTGGTGLERVRIAYGTAIAGSATARTAGVLFVGGTTTNFSGGTGQTGDVYGSNFDSLTYTATTASTIPDLVGVRVNGPIPSTNVTATRAQALLVLPAADANIGVTIRTNSGTGTGSWLSLQSSGAGAKLAFTPVSGDAEAVNIVITGTTGLKIGTATTQKLSFYGVAPLAQQTGVADATGGAIIDAEARTAINAVITRLELLGLIATL